MITEIDFPRLLQELQSLDVRKADNKTLVTYVAKLKYVEEMFLSSTESQQKSYEVSVFLMRSIFLSRKICRLVQ